MRILPVGVFAVVVICAGCETVPQLRASHGDAAATRRALVVITDARSASARVSLVERSGDRPIVMLGDDRFDAPPVELLERKLAQMRPDVSGLVVHRYDIRYVQGGSLDALNSSLSLSASMISPILGSLIYGGMSAKARRDEPSRVEITVECTWRGDPTVVKHQQSLAGQTESDELRGAIDASVDKVLAALPRR
jgi:hypothetical protein